MPKKGELFIEKESGLDRFRVDESDLNYIYFGYCPRQEYKKAVDQSLDPYDQPIWYLSRTGKNDPSDTEHAGEGKYNQKWTERAALTSWY